MIPVEDTRDMSPAERAFYEEVAAVRQQFDATQYALDRAMIDVGRVMLLLDCGIDVTGGTHVN